MTHIPVLKDEAVDSLALVKNSVVIDCTLGVGGHGHTIIKKLGQKGIYVGIDADPVAVSEAESLSTGAKAQVHLVNSNFKDLVSIVTKLGIPPPTAILADLGWRTDQFETGGKGFSFGSDEPLLMTYGEPSQYDFTAWDIVNEWEESSIADIVYGYGEERFSRRIAKAIVEKRVVEPIKTAKELAQIVSDSLPGVAKRGRLHPATKTFQALRIAVNDELGVLKRLIHDGFDILAPGGRMTIISFHSLEDRVVKQHFRALTHDQKAQLVNKKPIIADQEELHDNPRARSAKMRTIEKL